MTYLSRVEDASQEDEEIKPGSLYVTYVKPGDIYEVPDGWRVRDVFPPGPGDKMVTVVLEAK